MRLAAVVTLALLSAACDSEQGRAEKALADAEAIAQVEAAQNVVPPLVPVTPQEITSAELEKNNLVGAGCLFRSDDGKVLVVAMPSVAVMKVAGEMRVHAADSGSAPLAAGAWTHYDGKDNAIDLQIVEGESKRAADDGTDWPGRVTVRDGAERVVFTAAGTVECAVS